MGRASAGLSTRRTNENRLHNNIEDFEGIPVCKFQGCPSPLEDGRETRASLMSRRLGEQRDKTLVNAVDKRETDSLPERLQRA